MVPIVFYNGEEEWTAERELRKYQKCGEVFGSYVLNLEYYLVNLSAIETDEILSTNTVLDNIMYCDKYRKNLELAEAIRVAYNRIQMLGNQEKEEFNNWVKSILLSICGNKEKVLEEILNQAGNGAEDMAFKYNIIKAFEDEREEGKAEGKAEAIIELLELKGDVSEELRQRIKSQNDLSVLKEWLQEAAKVDSVETFEQFVVQ